jgi:hypothetical protein
MEFSAGFLIVKTFERMYRDYLTSFEKLRQSNSDFTHAPVPLERMPGKYRGVARDPMEPWYEDFSGSGLFDEPTEQELAANLLMTELRDAGKADGFFVFALNDTRKLFGMIQPPVEREIIWARRIDKTDPPPSEMIVLGYEPIDFYGDFTSLIANVLFFSYHQTTDTDDPDGMRAKIHHPRLNKWSLFNTPTHAQEYADSFPLLPEHERPDHIAEVRAFE